MIENNELSEIINSFILADLELPKNVFIIVLL